MKTKFFAAVLVVATVFCGVAFASGHEERYVREEAARRNIALISLEEAEQIVAQQFKSRNFRFKESELEDEADDYPNAINFRPVYKFDCKSEGREYDIEIDAVTGKVLKFKQDD